MLYKTEGSDFFYIENDDALLPVMVSGNKASNVFLILVHGGPGLGSFDYHNAEIIQTMESDYAIVYWDQRGSGAAQGNSGKELLTLEQFIEDTDRIVDAISSYYDNPSIFLMGHSWGGCLGTAYVLDVEHQDKINGWIDINGDHDSPRAKELSSQLVKDYASDKIAAGINIDEWQAVLNWYDDHALPFGMEQTAQHEIYVDKAFGSLTEGETNNMDSLTNLFFSPGSLIQLYGNFPFLQKHMDFLNISLTSQMDQILMPSLIIWGELDMSLPVALAYEAYDALGTAETDKYLTLLPHSGHNPVDSDATLFHQTISSFVERYR